MQQRTILVAESLWPFMNTHEGSTGSTVVSLTSSTALNLAASMLDYAVEQQPTAADALRVQHHTRVWPQQQLPAHSAQSIRRRALVSPSRCFPRRRQPELLNPAVAGVPAKTTHLPRHWTTSAMVRKYKSKKPEPPASPETCRAAIRRCYELGGPTERGALAKAALVGVNYATLRSWVIGHETVEEALAAFANKRKAGRQATMPPHLEASVVRLAMESFQRNISLSRGEFARIYYATAEEHGYKFKVRIVSVTAASAEFATSETSDKREFIGTVCFWLLLRSAGPGRGGRSAHEARTLRRARLKGRYAWHSNTVMIS